MLALLMGDLHTTGKNPIGRTDDIVETEFEKIDQIVSLSNRFDVPIIQIGDIFNVSIVANTILTRLGNSLEKLKNPLYFVWGNHDLLYHSMSVWRRTSLGVLWTNNQMVKHVSESPFEFDYLDWEGESITETGSKHLICHKAVITEKMIGKNSWISKDRDFSILIDKNEYLQRYKTIVCGHWHKQYSFRYKGTKVVNPGPVVRHSTTERNVRPKVILFNFKTGIGKDIHLKFKPFDKVFSEKHLNAKIHTTKDNNVSEYIRKIRDKIDNKKSTPNFMKRLINLLDSNELDKSIEKRMRDILSKSLEKQGEETKLS